MKNCLFIGALSSVVVTSMSSAAIITFTNAAAFGLASGNEGTSVFTENFDDLEGFYSNPLTGNLGGATWSATAFGGLFVGQVSSSPALSTAFAVPLTIQFTGNDVYGVSGNFFATNEGFSVVGNIVKITVGDGTVHIGCELKFSISWILFDRCGHNQHHALAAVLIWICISNYRQHVDSHDSCPKCTCTHRTCWILPTSTTLK